MPQAGYPRGLTRHPLPAPPPGMRLAERSTPVPSAAREAVAGLVRDWRLKAAAGFEVPPSPPRAGAEEILAVRVLGVRFTEPVRVVWADEQGFGYETRPGHPLLGEESFVLEDGTFTARSISRPATPRWRLLSPALRMLQRRALRRYVQAVAEVARGVD